jgi:hypothetical protein
MGARESIQRLIDKKQQELRDLQMQIREGNAYIQALQDSIRVLPRETADGRQELRATSALAHAREHIRNSGRPLHISELLKLLGKPTDKKNRVSLSGTISSYARRGKIFTKTAPNTFSLIELSGNGVSAPGTPLMEVEDLPQTFGRI